MKKEKEKAARRDNPAIWVASLLFCLTLLSLFVAGSLLARFSSEEKHTHEASVAAFSIVADGEMVSHFSYEISASGESASENFSVLLQNQSETAVSFTLEAENLTGNLPISLVLLEESGTGGSAQYSGDLAVGEERTCVLTIAWDEERDANSENNFLYHRELDDIAIRLDCEQMD